MVKSKLVKDYAPGLTASFTVKPADTALLLVDLQYASACRTTGLGKTHLDKGDGDVLKWRFDRIEQVVLPNLKRLLSFFHEHDLKVVYITVGAVMPDYSDAPPHMRKLFRSNNNREGTREHEILDEIKPRKGKDYVINKTTVSAFNSTGIDCLLRSIGAKYLLLGGVSTNMCVEGTARDASDKGYKCVILEDICSTGWEELHRTSLINFQRVYGRVTTTDRIMKELLRGL